MLIIKFDLDTNQYCCFQNKSSHQVLDVKSQRFEQQTTGVVQLFRENSSMCDHHPTAQHHRLSSTWIHTPQHTDQYHHTGSWSVD